MTHLIVRRPWLAVLVAILCILLCLSSFMLDLLYPRQPDFRLGAVDHRNAVPVALSLLILGSARMNLVLWLRRRRSGILSLWLALLLPERIARARLVQRLLGSDVAALFGIGLVITVSGGSLVSLFTKPPTAVVLTSNVHVLLVAVVINAIVLALIVG